MRIIQTAQWSIDLKPKYLCVDRTKPESPAAAAFREDVERQAEEMRQQFKGVPFDSENPS